MPKPSKTNSPLAPVYVACKPSRSAYNEEPQFATSATNVSPFLTLYSAFLSETNDPLVNSNVTFINNFGFASSVKSTKNPFLNVSTLFSLVKISTAKYVLPDAF